MRDRIAAKTRRIGSELSKRARKLAARSGIRFEPKITLLNPQSQPIALAGKPRMSVVGGSLGSNAVGRAYTLADLASADFAVEIVGTLLPTRGRNLWPPLGNAKIPIQGFVAADIPSYLSGVQAIVRSSSCEFVYVSKPRFSGLFIGMLMSMKNNCPLLLDIDDFELGFAKNRSPLPLNELEVEFRPRSRAISDDLAGAPWIRFCETLTNAADAITLSNEALQSRYDGVVVRHARDETQFFPDEMQRRAMRHEFGIRDDQTVVLFVGTPQPHKGLDRIAAAVSARKDDGIVLCIVGIADSAAARKRLGISDHRNVRLFPSQPLARLPDLIRAGDAVCLLQDASSVISEFQIPAKLSESLAMGLPVLASRVAPFADLIAAGAVKPIDTDDELRRALDDVRSETVDEQQAKRRDLFLSEFSYAANRPRLVHAVGRASARQASTMHARDAVVRQIAAFLASHFGINVMESV